MEKLPGRHLYQIWDELSMAYKKSVLSEITSVIVQLASLRFDKIGSLQLEKSGSSNTSLGPAYL